MSLTNSGRADALLIAANLLLGLEPIIALAHEASAVQPHEITEMLPDNRDESKEQCTKVNKGCYGGGSGMFATKPAAAEIPTDTIFDLPLSSEERAEIWSALGQLATATSIPAGLRIGEIVPNTTHLLSFSDDLRKEIPAIFRFSYTLLHEQVLIVDPRSKAIVSIVCSNRRALGPYVRAAGPAGLCSE